jgi:hypothetical protein
MSRKLPTLKELEGKYEPEELKDLTDEEVLKVFEGVETVWDYNPTEEELSRMALGLIGLNKVLYFREFGNDPETHNFAIYIILSLREKKSEAEKYFNLLSSEEQSRINELYAIGF